MSQNFDIGPIVFILGNVEICVGKKITLPSRRYLRTHRTFQIDKYDSKCNIHVQKIKLKKSIVNS